MRIFLDTHDLIRLFEKYSVINRLKIKEFFLEKKHVLVYSLNTILEISDPLNFPHQSRVMKTLNEMEGFPHIFVSESEISKLELLELINSYNKQEEFNKNNINPFRRRFDSVVAPYGGYEPPSIYRTPCLMGIIPVTRSYDEQQQLHKRI